MHRLVHGKIREYDEYIDFDYNNDIFDGILSDESEKEYSIDSSDNDETGVPS